MKTDKPRALALDTLVSLEKAGEYAGNYLEDIFTKNPGFDERDRGFISNLIQGVIRYRLRLDYIIGGFSKTPVKKIDITVLNILRLAIYQIYFMDRVPESAAVDRAVEQAKALKGQQHVVPFVNGILRNICRNKDGVKFPDRKKTTVKYLSSFYSFPLWHAQRCLDEFGLTQTEELFEAQNRFPSVNIRVDRVKTTADELVKALKDESIDAVHAEYVPDCLILENFSGRIERLSSFIKGLFQVQDQAAQAVSWLLDVKPGQTILDVCAGLGGKSSHLMELMGGKGSVTALDTDKRRLEMLHENARRLGLKNIKSVVADASEPFPDNLKGAFDRVLIDAPCSGLGTIGRHPDIKWNRSEIDIKRISRIQRKILENSFEAVKPGGLILYVVCTYTREENRTVIDNFLQKNSGASLVDMNNNAPLWARNLIDNDGFFRSYPHTHKMDGFFAALIKKER
ncbi:MAG: 16S rRNA (cytosine(967)-C(5))-methyltransferase RsmB [Desulfatiglans sp.]|jgi:16S rRNA (cytosine967-C5)-methyltransferase|nr:16S rRNA (cytosine(967)-C(5))-methyltransferase RsmB [Desulfatiglans sp.]